MWLIAIPLFDMTTVMLRRIKKGKSPFYPDRTHLHHICQRLGLSSKQTLIFIVFLSVLFSFIGIEGKLYHIPEYWMFYGFLALFMTYFLFLNKIWRISAYFRKKRILSLNN